MEPCVLPTPRMGWRRERWCFPHPPGSVSNTVGGNGTCTPLRPPLCPCTGAVKCPTMSPSQRKQAVKVSYPFNAYRGRVHPYVRLAPTIHVSLLLLFCDDSLVQQTASGNIAAAGVLHANDSGEHVSSYPPQAVTTAVSFSFSCPRSLCCLGCLFDEDSKEARKSPSFSLPPPPSRVVDAFLLFCRSSGALQEKRVRVSSNKKRHARWITTTESTATATDITPRCS